MRVWTRSGLSASVWPELLPQRPSGTRWPGSGSDNRPRTTRTGSLSGFSPQPHEVMGWTGTSSDWERERARAWGDQDLSLWLWLVGTSSPSSPPPPPPSLHLALAHPRTHIVSHLSCPYKARPHPRRDVVSSKEEDPWGFWVLPSSPVGPQGWEFLLRSSPLHPSPPPLSSSLWGKEKRHFAWFAVRTRLFSPSFSRPLRSLFLFSRFLLRPFFLSLMIKNKKKNLLKNLKKFLPWKVELNLQIRRKVQQNFKLLVFLRPRRLVLDLDVRVKKMSPVQKPRSVL